MEPRGSTIASDIARLAAATMWMFDAVGLIGYLINLFLVENDIDGPMSALFLVLGFLTAITVAAIASVIWMAASIYEAQLVQKAPSATADSAPPSPE